VRYVCPIVASFFLSSFGCRYVGGGSSGGGLSATVIDESALADKIKSLGGKSVEDFDREQAEKMKPKPFQGTGNSIRGGSVQTEAPSTATAENRHTIHLWKNGIRCRQPHVHALSDGFI
jgi:hypothetical protein